MNSPRPRRSVLYVPASNGKAIAKIASLSCDAVIFDLEDAVAPDDKIQSRTALKAYFDARNHNDTETIIRINALTSPWGPEDLTFAIELQPDAILLPKVETPRDILEAGDTLDDNDAPERVRLWAMVETPKALVNIGAIAELGRDPASRLACLVVGTNDLAKETGVLLTQDRRCLVPWLMQIVLAARAGGLVAIDGVCNDFRNIDGFARECAEGAAMGFDGKTLIHPTQIEPANSAFSPSAAEVAEAKRIITAFGLPGNAGKGVIALDGRMVERLHLARAEMTLARTRVKD